MGKRPGTPQPTPDGGRGLLGAGPRLEFRGPPGSERGVLPLRPGRGACACVRVGTGRVRVREGGPWQRRLLGSQLQQELWMGSLVLGLNGSSF